MEKILHPNATRGFRDMGWLKLYQSFNPTRPPAPDRKHFGAMVIFDNGHIAPGGKGFGMHPHRDMEIVSVVVSGTMVHSDTAGHNGVSLKDSVQIISAGTGIEHSEYNHSEHEPVDNLQIWFLPRQHNLPPAYHHRVVDANQREGHLKLLVSPDASEDTLPINQDVWLYRGSFQPGQAISYQRKLPGNGLYIYLISGKVLVAGETLGYRDALGLPTAGSVTIQPLEKADVLLIEVPMGQLN